MSKIPNVMDYRAIDGQPVHVFFMVISPASAGKTHLQALAKLSCLLIDPVVVNALKSATTPEEVIDIFKKADS
ncbi:PTS sugar transporter subunit IIA [Lactobacillus johnsonii]|uniref:PTS sugar transporter subunit IIA n=1 Tax=Lactobacillus johnsonii TaxID=33959 RepID=UPI003D288A5D